MSTRQHAVPEIHSWEAKDWINFHYQIYLIWLGQASMHTSIMKCQQNIYFAKFPTMDENIVYQHSACLINVYKLRRSYFPNKTFFFSFFLWVQHAKNTFSCLIIMFERRCLCPMTLFLHHPSILFISVVCGAIFP